MERKTVSIMKACQIMHVSRRSIYNWIAAGKVEYLRTAGGSIRIYADTLWRDPDGSRLQPKVTEFPGGEFYGLGRGGKLG